MKRMTLLVLAALLFLSSCHAQAEPPATESAAISVLPTEPPELYDADSEIEQRTRGALKAYPLSISDAVGVMPMGSDMLIFSGGDAATLTRYTGEGLRAAATAALPCPVSPDDGAVVITADAVSYYDAVQREMVFLDRELRETGRFPLPETISGAPALSEDLQMLYYSTGHALRCIDLETGLDRLLTQMFSCSLIPEKVHCDGAVIACDSLGDSGQRSKLYISTTTGQLLRECAAETALQTRGDSYFAQLKDGAYTQLLLGSSEHGPTLLTPHTYGSTVFPLLQTGGAVLTTRNASAGLQLDYYDLQSGRQTASVTLTGADTVRSVCAATQEQVWLLCYAPAYGCDVLYRWDLTKSETGDTRSCLSARYSAENPDLSGLAACRDIADTLSRRYGVQIHLWTDATVFQPWDYRLVPEYQVPVIKENLKELERFLSLYPQGFLQTAAAQTSSGCIQICLVRSILGNTDADGAVNEAVGLQYWDDNRNVYLCLSMSHGGLFRNACHEMSHIIDSRVLTYCKAYDGWNSLNPAGFQYTYDYTGLSSGSNLWTAGADRAFIDRYSTTFPKEDRARIMEYAVEAGNGDYFSSETMQKKLRTICLGIREAFGLKGTSEVLIWEQYLAQPIT